MRAFGRHIRRWLRRATSETPSDSGKPAADVARAGVTDPSLPQPHLAFKQPSSHFSEGDPIELVMLPAEGGLFEMAISPKPEGQQEPFVLIHNLARIRKGLPQGDYVIRARWRPEDGERDVWSPWSAPAKAVVHSKGDDINALRQADHRLANMLEFGVGGAITITDPDATPPGLIDPEASRWFATPCYEGATMLVNEEPEFYRDPFAYYLDCVETLKTRGVRFVTWHDILDGRIGEAETEIILQFDIDAGRHSMRRMFKALAERDVRATIMTHRRGHHWYPYELAEEDFAYFAAAERQGWAIGYHNNALSQCVGEGSAIGDKDRAAAAAIFSDDVAALRTCCDIRTFTHHGGNISNLLMGAPDDVDIQGVDRQHAPELWSSIATMFSDGGFVSRPGTLRAKVDGLGPGLHFFRNHPFKYANYEGTPDAPPRFEADLDKAGLPNDAETVEWIAAERAKEASWLSQRRSLRSQTRLSSLRLEKPISAKFAPFAEVEERVTRLRAKRRESFLNQYPWPEGDPRVFWWRMLDAWAPERGEALNVGALPPDQKDEADAFLKEIAVTDMDIDPDRAPALLCDIVAAPDDLNDRFDAIMLFGLPYFDRPSDAVAACERVTKPGGIGLFGFAADTNRERGGIWHLHNRPVWRRDREPLTEMGLRGNLWSFGEDDLDDLFSSWGDVKFEFMNDYWFAVATKHA